MKIYYGTDDFSIDVTDICMTKLMQDSRIFIPHGDNNRAHYFTDPLGGIEKKIIIENNDIFYSFDINVEIRINTIDNNITIINLNDINSKLKDMQSKLIFKYGESYYELPEQKMSTRYLKGHEKVLEIGANVGRNTLIIASILDDSRNLVSLECNKKIANELIENRDLNNFKFHVESAALSNRKLIQSGWNTIPSDTLLPGFEHVDSITLSDLKNKYNIDFDTLVLDCEGAFYYILMDMPEILNNINLIIVENDYPDINQKNYIDEQLRKNNFFVSYVESGGWGVCSDKFYEVWEKN